ncbi:unnamed protein product [Didymodactylos carnosus]|uniref:N-acetyltransferase domain-containing protein n=1 Tax=Didymodactylos carnosus TaxID=1234261 RepID=A0A813S5I8_9BILA|nr:unnamed protein product [Didymodactylos carnosus]CAF0964483.1 unnamed protein product [Didymodactylos carnosus]CAF3575427.1 unnamed protein product [Didymodactylos carnosus]CAF3736494.1 unnamed protein product [Didymodactylos carnosus]
MYNNLVLKHINKPHLTFDDRTSSTSSDSSCPGTPHSKIFPIPQMDLCLMNEAYSNEVFALISGSFFRDEPLNKCLCFELPDEPIEFTNLAIKIALQDKCSYVAIDTATQKVIAVILSVIESKNDETNLWDGSQFKSEKVRYVLKVLKCVHDNVDLFQTFDTDLLLHIIVVTIDESYRGLRITEKLIHSSLERAKQVGIKAVFSEATSLYSSKAFRKLGFQIYNEVIYSKYDKIRLSNLDEHDRCVLVATNTV